MAEALSALSHDTPYATSMADATQALRTVSQTTLDRRAVDSQTKLLDYIDLWQSTVTTRIQNDMQQTNALRREVDHYTTKVDALHQAKIRKLTKGQQQEFAPGGSGTEKMDRNEQKLQHAQQVYRKAAREHYWMLDEVVNRSWRDLHPILLQLLQLDTALAKDSSSRNVLDKYETALAAIQRQVQQQQQQHQSGGPWPKQRLQSIATATPQELNPNPSSSSSALRSSAPGRSSTSSSPPSYGGGGPPPPVTTRTPTTSTNRKNPLSSSPQQPRSTSQPRTTRPASPARRQASPPRASSRPARPSSPSRRFWGGNNNNNNRSEPAPPPESRSSSTQRYRPNKSPGRRGSAGFQNNNNNNTGSSNPASPSSKRKPMVSIPWRNNNNNNNNNNTPSVSVTPAASAPTKNSSRPQPTKLFPRHKAAPAAPASPRADRRDMEPRAPRTTGKGGKVAASSPSATHNNSNNNNNDSPWAGADPAKWKFLEQHFAGSFVFEEKGQSEQVMAPIAKGRDKFRADPDKYLYLFYQSNMLEWPTNQQRYTLIHREGSKGHVPTGISPRGPMTILTQYYERLPPFPQHTLPNQYRDAHTDHMTHQRRKLHSPKNKPILPGRGMGVGDTPNLKIIGDVDPSDIHQGTVGDCWLLSGISSLAEFDGAIKHIYRKTTKLEQRPLEGPNQYILSLWDLETWTERDIVVDERLPVTADGTGQLLASRPSEDGELWVCYLEKALAIHCGGWDKVTGGQCTHAWALLTGCKEQYTIRINPATGKFACYGKYNPHERRWARHANCPHEGEQSLWRNAWPEVGGGGGPNVELTQEELFMKMCAWDDVNYIVGAGCSDKSGDAGLVDNHAYSVIECHNDVAGTPIDLIKVRNPWGKGEIEDGEFDDDGPGWDKYPQIKRALNPVVADDGIFWVTKDEFFQFFSTIYLSASNMTEFLED